MIKALDDKVFNLNVSHARIAKGMDEEFKHKVDEIKNFQGDLREGIEAETVQREEGIVLLTEQIEREVRKVGGNQQIENKIREEACKKQTSMFDDSYNKLRGIIVNEKRERDENSDAILRLLEETCNKQDRKIHKY